MKPRDRVLASADLLSWEEIGAFTAGDNGAEFTDSHILDFPRRFYRVVSP